MRWEASGELFQMGITWLYICLGALGGLAPVVILYAVNYDRRVPGAFIDLGLLFFSAGVGILLVPVGLGAGVALAALVHWVLNRVNTRRTAGGS